MSIMNPDTSDSGLLAQILLKQGEMSTQLAVIGEQLKPVQDHEQRIRGIEAAIQRVKGIAGLVSLLSGGGAGAAIAELLNHIK